jgi:hypothetical protein
MMRSAMMIVPAAVLLVLAGRAQAQNYTEVEPNETKALAAANNVVTLSTTPNGTTTFAGLTGVSSQLSATNPAPANTDMFLVRSASRPAAIYFNTLTVSVPLANSSIGTYALSRSDNNLGQLSTNGGVAAGLGTGARASRWYSWGSGNAGEVNYHAVANSLNPYVATYTSVAVTPDTVGGSGFDTSANPSGQFTITTRGLSTADTRMILLDGNFNQLRWNDNSPAGVGGAAASSQSTIVQSLAEGIYYVAVATGVMIQSQPFESSATEGQTGTTFPTASRTDFANVAFSTTQITGTNSVGLGISFDGGAAVFGPARSLTLGGFAWYQFSVIPAPSAAALLGISGLVATRRRRSA